MKHPSTPIHTQYRPRYTGTQVHTQYRHRYTGTYTLQTKVHRYIHITDKIHRYKKVQVYMYTCTQVHRYIHITDTGT